MRIVIVAFGTWGDVRPNVVLGQALQKAGQDVLVVAAAEFRQWVEGHGLAFAGLSVNIQAMLESLASDSTNTFKTMQAVNRIIGPALVQMGQEIALVVKEGDALLANEGGLGLLNGIVEKYHLRLIHINLQPLAPTREFPGLAMPVLPKWIPAYNRGTGRLSQRITWALFGKRGNELREQHLGLGKQKSANHRAILDSTPSLTLVSRHVISPPADWPPHQRITGYLFDDEGDWAAPQDLTDFLAPGEKPIYIGFGSMGDRQPEVTSRLILEAVQRSGKRVILLTGWAGIGAVELPKNIFLLRYAPHNWLFPRMAAVVHHGGAGTTASGLRAGVPSIVIPFFGDQSDWAWRTHALGVGTKPIPRFKLTAENLAAAIHEATINRAMQEKAVELGAKIAAEDGVGTAVETVQKLLV
jgi:UDP:flavonoid glycosyltransferase YjiC (YdhE family)